jgi:phosphatidate cytidylyltransferase
MRPRSGDERLLRGRPADDAVRPGRSVFDDELDDDYDEEDDFDDEYEDDDDDDEEDDDVDEDEEEDDYDDDDDDVELPHWTQPPSGQTPAATRRDADAWTSLTGSQPRWRESASDYDDEPEITDTADDDYDSEAAAEEFFEFDDENNADFDRFMADEQRLGPADEEVAPIPISHAASSGAGRAGAAAAGGAAARGTAKKAASKSARDARPAARRRNDMRTRVMTGVVLGLLAIAAFVTGSAATVGLTSIVLGLCVIELSNALRRAGYQPATLLAIVASVGAPIATYQRGIDALLVVVAVTTAFSFLWFLAKAGDESPVLNAGVTTLSVMYIGVLGSYGALMLRVFDHYGIGMIVAAVLGTIGHDIGALLVGRSAGKTKLTSVSPGKTREGLIGGMLSAIVVVVVVVGMFKIAPFGQVPDDRKGLWFGGMGQAAWLGIAIAITAPLGDLVESLIKRDLGVKDMGNILKGHGGVLDRFDALLFTLPTTYYMGRFLIL